MSEFGSWDDLSPELGNSLPQDCSDASAPDPEFMFTSDGHEQGEECPEPVLRELGSLGAANAMTVPDNYEGDSDAASPESSEVKVPTFHELTGDAPHEVARTEVNAKLIKMARIEAGVDGVERYPVPDSAVSWDVDLPGYDPTYIDLPRGNTRFRLGEDRPDPEDPNQIESFTSLETDNVQRDERGYPLNPMGRTGLTGRGMLNQWGPTPAADPILTRNNPETGVVEALLIQRGDTGERALPGGKVDPGEQPWQTAGRELVEEAGVQNVALDFRAAKEVYAGYVDDSRNTDNAWMETTALHLRLDDQQSRDVVVEAGSDAAAVAWVTAHEGLYPKLFASQGDYLKLAIGEVEVGYAHRQQIPDGQKDWSVDAPFYCPPAFTTEWVKTTGVELGASDPESPREVDFSERPSFVGEYNIDAEGRPLNPMGRQGLSDRGDLAKWGPNNAADPILIATTPETSDRKILLIRRADTGAWALPGGMVDPGEHVSKTALRELGEETGVDLRGMEGRVVYEGYVDDPRNTDNAWMETTARVFDLSYTPEAHAGDDAADAQWFGCNTLEQLKREIRELDSLDPSVEPLYASHSQIIGAALRPH
ncbi:MAG TPA: NUDIX domain-containing protein [Candidatus Saccharimonadales bacterium]